MRTMSSSSDRPVYMSCVFFNGVLGLAIYEEDIEEVVCINEGFLADICVGQWVSGMGR